MADKKERPSKKLTPEEQNRVEKCKNCPYVYIDAGAGDIYKYCCGYIDVMHKRRDMSPMECTHNLDVVKVNKRKMGDKSSIIYRKHYKEV